MIKSQGDINEHPPDQHRQYRRGAETVASDIQKQLLLSGHDCLVSTNVLEHVPAPLKLFSEMVGNVKIDGYLIIANNFCPVIKCHLPSTFHLRYTFRIFTHIMGLRMIGPCEGSHATIYQKKKDITLNLQRIRKYKKISKMLYPILSYIHMNIYRRLKIIITGGRK